MSKKSDSNSLTLATISIPDQAPGPTTSPHTPYIGRFAPSPTGPLHAGSLIAGLASYLDAKANEGIWYVRMEDLDPPRESPQAASEILLTLETLGLNWDGEVLYQSQRQTAYQEALDFLTDKNLCFACDCSRQQIQAAGGIYPGTCRNRTLSADTIQAVRCRVKPIRINFQDKFQGEQSQLLNKDVGDFVIKRKDDFFAYQLAVVVDDAFQNITHIIRGTDLLDSSCRQIYLQTLLDYPTPVYGHLPVIVNHLGQKLSKQRFATPVDASVPQKLLITGLNYLRQDLDPDLVACAKEDILQWAIEHWNPQKLAGLQQLQEFVPFPKPAV